MKRKPFAGALALLASAAFFVSLAPAGAQRDEQPPPDNGRPEAPPAQQVEQPSRTAPDYGPETARATIAAARRYADIAAKDGWPHIAALVTPESKGHLIAALRRRLAIEGYLSREDGKRDEWDDTLSDALRRFQAHVGLAQTGAVSRETLRELNVPPATRARKLAATAARLARMRFRFGDRYVVVNIPAASVEAVEKDEAVKRYTAVVGGRRHPSPQVVAKIVSIDINPTWTVPASIIKKELAPKLKRNPHYFERENIRILDARGHEVDPLKLRRMSSKRAASFTFRQEPGPKNSLGSIRVFMPNNHAVFMHDTPHKNLFDKDYRFLSHGCVRVEGVYDLASWLLQDTGDWDASRLKDEEERGRTEKIGLRRPVPVAWVYMTGWATDDGPAHFRRDIYDLDKGTKLPAQNGAGVAHS
ncbi:L,D-transpeptidase family protein [Methylocystis sp. JAN1]|uniref:L,D-transpeptidase family protein n=1 Tax=Methylocystis sp. JAN1 TaxID=3397211 RepID=UPI003FA2CEB4